MAAYVRTVEDIGSILLDLPVFKDDLLTFGAAGTVVAGTILARDTGSLKLVPYVKGGTTTGNGVPCTLVVDDIVASAASDIPVRSLVTGRVNLTRLIINADGTGANIDAAVIDQLRARGIYPDSVKQLAKLDN